MKGLCKGYCRTGGPAQGGPSRGAGAKTGTTAEERAARLRSLPGPRLPNAPRPGPRPAGTCRTAGSGGHRPASPNQTPEQHHLRPGQRARAPQPRAPP